MSNRNKISKKEVLQFSAAHIFNVVIDVEKYPEFLPWCKSIKIISREQNQIIADTKISFKGIEAYYESIINYCPPGELSSGYIRVESSQGIFVRLLNSWKFVPQNHNSTLVVFDIDFELKSALMQSLVGMMYKKAQEKVVQSFCTRIKTLYLK